MPVAVTMTHPRGSCGSRSAESSRSNATRLAGKDIARMGSSNVVDCDELDRLKKRAVILTDADLKNLQSEQQQQFSASRHKAEERKQRMMEKELAVRARREQSAMEMELEAEKKAVLTGDEALRNQHLVSLRKIQSLALQVNGYMACDALKAHQQEREKMELKYNQIHDSIMAQERQADLAKRKCDEAEAQAKRMEARKVLEQQIAERQKKAIWEEEAKAIEAQKILNTYKQYEAEEQEKIHQQQLRKQEITKQVAQTNDVIKQRKEAAIQREKHEEMVAAAYLRKKAQEEEAKIQEEQRLRKAKELRTAKLRAQQEKAQDKQALQDEFRAKKAAEEAEKQMRLKEKREKEAKVALMQTILEDRKQQEAFHRQQEVQLKAMDAHMDRLGKLHVDEEYLRHHALEEAAKKRERAHGEQLKQQIIANDQRRAREKLFEQNDAKFVKKKSMKDAILAEKVRQDTLHKLEKQGAPEEYLRELRRMSINETNA